MFQRLKVLMLIYKYLKYIYFLSTITIIHPEYSYHLLPNDLTTPGIPRILPWNPSSSPLQNPSPLMANNIAKYINSLRLKAHVNVPAWALSALAHLHAFDQTSFLMIRISVWCAKIYTHVVNIQGPPHANCCLLQPYFASHTYQGR